MRVMGVGAIAAGATLGFLGGSRYASHHPTAARAPAALSSPNATLAHVPHLSGSITLDGDTDDPGWRGASLRTGAFVGQDGSSPVHPHSEARAVWGDGFLYLNLYAADEDIRASGTGSDALSASEDTFHLVFTDGKNERTFDLNPLGAVTDGIRALGGKAPADTSWNSGAHVSHELDGTPNEPNDNDEEWVLEVAIPLESLGLRPRPGERIGLSMHRCDTPHGGTRICGSWGEEGAPKVLVLDPPS